MIHKKTRIAAGKIIDDWEAFVSQVQTFASSVASTSSNKSVPSSAMIFNSSVQKATQHNNNSINVNISSAAPLDRQESFGSDDYHPNRKYLHIYEDEPAWPETAGDDKWVIGGVNISNELEQFKKLSNQINANQGNMSDLRILAIHLIFSFMMSANLSVVKYMSPQARRLVETNLPKPYQPPPPATTTNLLLWRDELRTAKLDWFGMKNECRGT